MKTEIQKKYSVKFQNRVLEDGSIMKSVVTNIEFLDLFLNECGPNKLTDSILPKMDEVLSGVSIEVETGTEGIHMLIYQDRVTLDRYDEIEISIPTLDIRQIIEAYRDFLLSLPLDGTIVK